MDDFRFHEMRRFVSHSIYKETNSSWCAKQIQLHDDNFNAPTEDMPYIIPYLKSLYAISEGPHDSAYIEDRILYYEGMIQYETIKYCVPKNILRRRKIEKNISTP